MPENYKIINEKNWKRAMHCAVFRNSVEPAFCVTSVFSYSMGKLHAYNHIQIPERKRMQLRFLIGENILKKTKECFCRFQFRHIIHLLMEYILESYIIKYKNF